MEIGQKLAIENGGPFRIEVCIILIEKIHFFEMFRVFKMLELSVRSAMTLVQLYLQRHPQN